ncbi:YcaO-like family protein [Sphaerisporangium fuscum]|uniref:YcaO-like family protein n=1 Tax=Sphaerisporangium fuscum TaxID=2835868 RepID=UPI001BDCCF72|nr:YcaO-like family protein [Sphaerisporangium fuscum]
MLTRASLVTMVTSRQDGQVVGEILLGRMTHPEVIHRATGASPGIGLAVLEWRGSVHVLKYGSPGTGPCPNCLRGHLTSQQVVGYTSSEPGRDDVWESLDDATRDIVAALAGASRDARFPVGNLITLDLVTMEVGQREVPPRSQCRSCRPPHSTRAEFSTDPASLAKAPGSFHSARPLPADLSRAYVGPQTLFKRPMADLDSAVPAAQVSIPLRTGELEPGVGRTSSLRRSREVAILEALERYAGFCHSAGDGRIPGSLADLGPAAIDPRELGYHLPRCYARPDFPFAELSPDEVTDWVEVTPAGGGPPRYLPERALYWAERPGRAKAFFADSSNGYALGRTVDEAALHGMLEVIERDAFLLTWYRRLRLPEIELDHHHRDLRDIIARVELFSGFRIRLFWAGLDTGIPVVVALARNESPTGPCTFVSAGASLDAAQAAESAVREVAAILAAISVTYLDDLPRAHAMAQDFTLVTTMLDHCLVGALPSSRPWFDFLTESPAPTMKLSEVPSDYPGFDSIADDLGYVTAKVSHAGHQAYVADVTTPELRWRDFVCVRAVIPGFLPMTFGHDLRRTEGLPRLTTATLPYPSQLRPGESHLDVPPHTFP